jgi:O-antigen/teichoic acid export membrane protein
VSAHNPKGAIPLTSRGFPFSIYAAIRLAGSWTQWRSWIAKGLTAVLDQGLISCSNFFLAILLARWLGAAAYGAYALAFATFILVSLLHQALILEPMSVFGSSTYRQSVGKYLGVLLWLQTSLAVVLVLLATIGVVVHSRGGFGQLELAFLGVTFAAPCVFLFWFGRRAFYLELRPGRALSAAFIYSALLLTGIWVLSRKEMLTPLTAFVVMGIAALITSVLLLLRLHLKLKPSINLPLLREVAHRHWHYGRWALAAAFFMWIPWNVFYTLLAACSGLAEVGTLRALLNLALPITQTFAAFSLLFLPHTSRVGQNEGWAGVKVQAIRIAGLFTFGATVYWLLLILFSTRIINFLYAGHYTEVAQLLPWIAVASILTGATLGPAIALRALHSPASVCIIYFGSSVVALALGIPAVWAWGVRGAVFAILVSNITAAASAVLMLRHWWRRERQEIRGARAGAIPAESPTLSSF